MSGDMAVATGPGSNDVTAAKTVIRMEGVFDAPAARRLAANLDDAGYAEVRIDLTRVREFHDFGVALLAQTIAGRRAPTAVLGLHEHHLRLLRHLGIDCGGANLSAGVELV
ncbi:MAG TPA: STAS domain-containing protein [Anaeromyxobacter sp.]